MQTDYSNYFPNLHRMIDMGSDATKFTEESKYHLLSNEKIAGFISLSIGSYKINKIIKLLNKIISTESCTRNMDLKILPEPKYDQNMFHKNYQSLFLQEKIIIHLTLHELAY